MRLRTPEVAFAHPLDGGRAAQSSRARSRTRPKGLGGDGGAYCAPARARSSRNADAVVSTVLAPLRSLPKRPLVMAHFARRRHAVGRAARAPFLDRGSKEPPRWGVRARDACHSTAPLTAAFGIFLTLTAHAGGWPVVEGGSARLIEALEASSSRAGGTIHTGQWITKLSDLPPARATLFDTSPETLVAVGGRAVARALPTRHRALSLRPGHLQGRLGAVGPGAVDGARVPARGHGARRRELRRGRRRGGRRRRRSPPRAAVLPRRPVERRRCDARAGGAGHAVGLLPRAQRIHRRHDRSLIEAQIERFAPGFKDLVLARSTMTADGERASQPELRGRRHQRRRRYSTPDDLPTDRALESLSNRRPGAVPLLGLDVAGRRGARDVRRRRCPSGARRPSSPT